jgi:hypothetical protein
MNDTDSRMDTLIAALYRLAAYVSHNLIDDAAMLAFIFS